MAYRYSALSASLSMTSLPRRAWFGQGLFAACLGRKRCPPRVQSCDKSTTASIVDAPEIEYINCSRGPAAAGDVDKDELAGESTSDDVRELVNVQFESSGGTVPEEGYQCFQKVSREESSVEDAVQTYRPHIDGLRAVAVLAVLAYHVDKRWLPGGFTGVDIFFVISGYVVAGSLLSHTAETAAEYVFAFYARRLKRLVPALALVTCCTGLGTAMVLPPWMPELDEFYFAGILGLMGISNNYLGAEAAGGVFPGSFARIGAPGLQNPFLHTWSLGVEEQFYFIFPAIVILGHGQRVVRSTRWWPKWPTSVLLLSCGVFASLVASGVLTALHQRVAFYVLPCRYWELALGSLLYDVEVSSTNKDRADRAVAVALELAASVLLVVAVSVTPETTKFPLPWAALPVGSAALFIMAGVGMQGCSSTCLSHWIPVCIGRLSYPIYLWHWPVLALSSAYLQRTSVTVLHSMPSWCIQMAQLALVLVLAVATRAVEGIFSHWRPRPWKAFVVTSAMVLTSALWLAVLCGPFRGELYLGSCAPWSNTIYGRGEYAELDCEETFKRWRDQAPAKVFDLGSSANNESDPTSKDVVAPQTFDAPASITGSSTAGNGRSAVTSTTPSITDTKRPHRCECCMKDKTFHVPAGARQCMDPSEAIPCFVEREQCASPSRNGPCFIERKPYSKWFVNPSEEECWCSQGASCIARIDSCLFPKRGSDGTGRVLFLVGDSHATMYVMALRKVIEGSMSLVFMSRSGSDCFRSPSGQEVYCAHMKRSIRQSLRPGDIVAMSYGTARFTNIAKAWSRQGSLSSVKRYVSTLQGWHKLVTSRNASLLILGDQTPLRQPGITCAPANISSGLGPSASLARSSPCSRSALWSELYGKHLRSELRKLEAEWPNVTHFFDPRGLFCGKDTCGTLVPGTRTLATSKGEHLTVEASFYMWPFLCSFFQDRGLLDSFPQDIVE
mmetsp:Transcript_70399/g.139664  ORF Transcript_70399/g.139664 Transcript_70399/m.139664 type:complete len:955 (+) Transcript_70399:70-2934(+)